MVESQTDEMFEDIVETIREPLLVLDQDQRVILANCSFYDFFKEKPEETVGQLIYDLGNKQWDIPKLRELLETILPQHVKFNNYEVEHDFAAIGKRIMLLNARQIERALGKNGIILLAFEDITERRQLEDLLTESEFRYRRLFETASDGIVLLEKCKGHIVHANPAATKILGYSEEECIGKVLKDIGIPIEMTDFPKIMESLIKSSILNYEDVLVKTKSGRDIYTDIYLVDRAKLAQCNIRDINERKLSEEQLQYSEKKYRSLFNSIRDAILVTDTTRTIIDCNPAFIELFGYSKVEALGKQTISIYENEEEFKQMGAAIKDHVGDKSFLHTVHYKKQDGSVFPGETNVFYLKDDEGLIIGFIGLIRDGTERKQAKEERKQLQSQLSHAQKMESVGRLAGGVAHDYNNISSIIIGYSELALENIDQGTPLHEDLTEILMAAKRSTQVTRQLLAFARQQTIAPKVLDLNDIISNMLKMLRRLIGEDIDLAWVPGGGIWPIKIDPSQVDQILANLCVNSRDAILGVGKITIETKMVFFDKAYCADHYGFTPGRFVMLAVSDNGCGMDNEILDNIFEPFFTTKDVDKGTGLGLSIVYGIVKQNKGFINVYSEPGSGTTIKIYLPRHKDNAIDFQWQNTEDILPGQGETVMVVEDDRSILKLTEKILKGLGYIVLTANRPKGAIKLIKEHAGNIHLLVTDVIMPEMNGLELVNSIQSVYPNIKSVFMSGYTADTIARNGVLNEGVHFIQKPFSKKDLAKTIRNALDEITESVEG